MRIFNGISELTAAAGQELGTSDWVTVDQERINTCVAESIVRYIA